jgi:hypothetical protein
MDDFEVFDPPIINTECPFSILISKNDKTNDLNQNIIYNKD